MHTSHRLKLLIDLQVRLMKTGAMRHLAGIDADGLNTKKAKQFAKTVGHGIESVSVLHIHFQMWCFNASIMDAFFRWLTVFLSRSLVAPSAR